VQLKLYPLHEAIEHVHGEKSLQNEPKELQKRLPGIAPEGVVR
jgi:hypothetical protein